MAHVGAIPRLGTDSAPKSVDARLAWPVKLFLLSLFVPIAFQVGALAFTSTRIVVLIMVIPAMLKLLSGQLGKIYLVDIMFILHIFWMGVALAVNSPQSVVEQVGAVGAEFLGSYLIGRAYIQNRYQFYTLCKTLIWVVFILLPFTLAESQTGRPYIVEAIRSLPVVTSHGMVFADPRLGLHRVQGPFGHPIHFGLFCAMTIPMAFFMFRNKVSVGLQGLLVGVTLLSVFLSLSAGALMAVVGQIGLIGWYVLFRQVPYKWIWLSLFLALMYITVDLLSNRTPMRVFFTYGTFSPHTAYWRAIIFDWGMMNIFGSEKQNIPPAPIFGIGLKDWIRPPYMYSGSMDNYWLVTGVRYGVPGFLFLAIGYFSTVWRIGLRKDFEHDTDLMNIRRCWVIIFVSLALSLCTAHLWDSIYSFVFFIFGSGLWLLKPSLGEQTEAETPDPQEAASTRQIRYSRFPAETASRRGS